MRGRWKLTGVLVDQGAGRSDRYFFSVSAGLPGDGDRRQCRDHRINYRAIPCAARPLTWSSRARRPGEGSPENGLSQPIP